MSWWTDHGTKIIGGLTAVVSTVAATDPSAIPPSWMPYLAGLAGLATLLRGFTNTATLNNQGLPPPIGK